MMKKDLKKEEVFGKDNFENLFKEIFKNSFSMFHDTNTGKSSVAYHEYKIKECEYRIEKLKSYIDIHKKKLKEIEDNKKKKSS